MIACKQGRILSQQFLCNQSKEKDKDKYDEKDEDNDKRWSCDTSNANIPRGRLIGSFSATLINNNNNNIQNAVVFVFVDIVFWICPFSELGGGGGRGLHEDCYGRSKPCHTGGKCIYMENEYMDHSLVDSGHMGDKFNGFNCSREP